jgi:hypothetical protein
MSGDHLRVVVLRFPELAPRGVEDGERRTVVYWTRSMLYSQDFNVEVEGGGRCVRCIRG